ncbi:MAG: hypothetical protein ACETWK_10645 [Candidatus Aminicenantaceae bacterium]
MRIILTERKKRSERISRIIGLSLIVILIVAAGSISCKKKAEEEATTEEGVVIKKGINEFEGVVKVAVGKYFYLPSAKGIDMVFPGTAESGDASTLVDKEVRVRGEFSHDRPSILVVDTVDIKEPEKEWKNIYTRIEEVVLDDYLDSKYRDEFKAFKNIAYNKSEGWEGTEKAKVYGKLEETTVTQAGEEKSSYKIAVLNESGREIGKIIVDNLTDYALYSLKKLKLFDKYWFYFNVKETVDWRIRRRTRELFHADVVFAGLY